MAHRAAVTEITRRSRRLVFPMTRSPDVPMIRWHGGYPLRSLRIQRTYEASPRGENVARRKNPGSPRKPGFGLLGWKFAAPQRVMVSEAPLLRESNHLERAKRIPAITGSPDELQVFKERKSDQISSVCPRGGELFSTVPRRCFRTAALHDSAAPKALHTGTAGDVIAAR
jgi:hypothetical protein